MGLEPLPSAGSVANILGAFALAIADQVRNVSPTERCDPTATAALVHLFKYPGTSIDALRAPLQLSHSGCVRLVDRLENGGFVTRGHGEEGRTVAVRLTTRGSRMVKSALAGRRSLLMTTIEDLTPDEQASLARLLSKVLHRHVRDERHALQICRLCDYANCPDATCPVGNSLALTGEQKGMIMTTSVGSDPGGPPPRASRAEGAIR